MTKKIAKKSSKSKTKKSSTEQTTSQEISSHEVLTKAQIFKQQVEIMLEDFSDEKKDPITNSLDRSTLIMEIERVWAIYPYMRLGQLLINISGHRDIFYLRDKDLLEKFNNLGK